MFDRIRSNLSQANYGGLLFELFVVVIGILIAFQIDRWGDERADQALERNYLERLVADLRLEVERLDEALVFADRRVAAAKFVYQFALDPDVAAEQPEQVPAALEKSTWRSFPQINAIVYKELQSSGNLGLIRSRPLRRALASHYQAVDHSARVGNEREAQLRFDALTAGILSMDELLNIEADTRDGRDTGTSAERARAIARALASRPEAVALLPSIAQHNLFNAKVIRQARDRSVAIIEQINQLLEAEPPALPTS